MINLANMRHSETNGRRGSKFTYTAIIKSLLHFNFQHTYLEWSSKYQIYYIIISVTIFSDAVIFFIKYTKGYCM